MGRLNRIGTGSVATGSKRGPLHGNGLGCGEHQIGAWTQGFLLGLTQCLVCDGKGLFALHMHCICVQSIQTLCLHFPNLLSNLVQSP